MHQRPEISANEEKVGIRSTYIYKALEICITKRLAQVKTNLSNKNIKSVALLYFCLKQPKSI